MKERVGIIQTRGLGDIIIALPIADYYLELGHEVFWPVEASWAGFLSRAKPGVKFLEVRSEAGYFYQAPAALLAAAGCTKTVCLYSHLTTDKVYDEKLAYSLKFDEYKYAIAGVPFERKWSLRIERSRDRELALHDRLSISEDYICVHTQGTGFKSNLQLDSRLREHYQVVQVDEITDNPFDWIYTLERAKKLILLDSCFSNLVEQLNLPNEKYLILRSPCAFTPVMKNGWKYLSPDWVG